MAVAKNRKDNWGKGVINEEVFGKTNDKKINWLKLFEIGKPTELVTS